MLLLLKTPGMWEGWGLAPFFFYLWEILFHLMLIKAEKKRTAHDRILPCQRRVAIHKTVIRHRKTPPQI